MLNTVLMDSWYFFKNHLFSIALIVFPIVIPLEILTSIYIYHFTNEDSGILELFLPLSISTLLYPIYSVAIVLYIASVVSGDPVSLKGLYAKGLNLWLPYLTITVLISIIVIGGFMLLIIPGIIFILRYSFAEFELVLAGKKPLNAMKSSWKSTSDHLSVLFFGYAIISFCIFTPSAIITSLLDESSIFSYILTAILNIIYAVLYTFYTIYAYRIYQLKNTNITSSSSAANNP